MADLFSLLSLGANALSAHRAASATASHNLENASTDGYARQRANLAAVLPAYRLGGSFLGRGVTLQSVTQARDFGAERQFALAHESRSRTEAQATALEGLASLDPKAAGTLSAAMADFYSALRQLQQSPADATLRQALVGQAHTVALAFNRTATDVDAARDAVDTRLSSQVSEVNNLAQQMASLNQQVRIARSSGAEPNDLLDARQKVQDRLTELVGAHAVPTDDGDINLDLPNGVALVSQDSAGTFSVAPDSLNAGHLKLELTRPGTTTPQAVLSVGGAFGGMLQARDGALKSLETSVDTLAFDWANTLNATHRAGFALDGSTGRDLFDVGALTGAAGRLAVNSTISGNPSFIAAATSATTTPGDGRNLQALIATEGAALSNGLNAFANLAAMIAGYGASTQQARGAADADAAILDHVTSLRESVSGVSIDEEMIELTKAQRGFEAVMKVITTTNEMLDTLMSLKP